MSHSRFRTLSPTFSWRYLATTSWKHAYHLQVNNGAARYMVVSSGNANSILMTKLYEPRIDLESNYLGGRGRSKIPAVGVLMPLASSSTHLHSPVIAFSSFVASVASSLWETRRSVLRNLIFLVVHVHVTVGCRRWPPC
jgi:hypothetical protein